MWPEPGVMVRHSPVGLAGTGVKVYNYSPLTDLEWFPKIPCDEALSL